MSCCRSRFLSSPLLASFVAMFCVLTCGSHARSAEVSAPRHGVIASDRGKIVRFDEQGRPVWTYDGVRQVHRIQQLANGNILAQQDWQTIIEIAPDGSVVWSYEAGKSNGNAGKKVEVHAFQRLPDGSTMIVENGVGRIIEVDAQGTMLHELNYQVAEPDAHRDVRQAHKLDNGNYLVCHEAEGRVTEYDRQGGIVWDYSVPLFNKEPRSGHGLDAWGNQVFNALRLPNGNTLIATGNGHSVLEVTPEKKIIWELHQHDLPGIALSWVTSLELLPDGNLIIGNCHAGPDNPQLIEITREKEVVWTFRDFETLGNSTAASATAGWNADIVR